MKAHSLSMDFESWIFLEGVNKKRLSNNELKKLDNGNTLKSLDYVLKTLKKYNQKITFFVVFKLEEIYPGLIDEIRSHGHEIGWHGHTHAHMYDNSILHQELTASAKLLKKYKIKGFQAPKIIFFKEGYKTLKDFGFTYSSSIYGNTERIYCFDGIFEIPVTTSNEKYLPLKNKIKFPSNVNVPNLLEFGLPYGSSYFWSILGKRYYSNKFKSANKREKKLNLFIHNWQLIDHKSSFELHREESDKLALLSKIAYHPYTKNVKPVFEHLLKSFSFQKCIDFLNEKKSISHTA